MSSPKSSLTASSPASSRGPLLVGLVGLAVVTAYAVFAAVQILILNPLAAVPGMSLAEISSELAATGETFNIPVVLGILAVGPLLAVVVAILSLRTDATRGGTALALLAILAAGALGYFAASFGPGMSLADAFGISGADYSRWSVVLYIVSAAAVVAALPVGLLASRRSAPAVAVASGVASGVA